MTSAPTQPTAVAINARPIPAPSPNAKPPIRLPPLSTSMSFCRSLGSVPIKQALRGPQVVRQPRQRVPSLIIVLAFGNIPCLVRLIKAGNLTYQRSVGSEGNVQAMSHGRAGTNHKRGYRSDKGPLLWSGPAPVIAQHVKPRGMGHTIKEIHIVLKTLGSNTVLARDAQLDDLPGPNEVRVSDVAVCFYNLINGTSNFLGALGPIVPRYDAIEVISRLNFVGEKRKRNYSWCLLP